ncbi:50S ribosomal protein L22 [Varunaivibrio sulfuroxidans]|uniref:Large ribosomal subunit protein uL22 n=1 Tax=Varunaivibrio sulfuroxidans TaxID=1773489 RepID=A0A4R3J9H3_9PROT|nr:50S ribosomal protein L22 [Varunaivibrio sulfuroxidans]TCS62055.1 LSU ribosomal protein L22P [Varunaivibrio sulfuroxidans]WES30488.1 50S ribosomal protein L22 [Varunaivibrio sulfuroxidans]
MGKKAFVSQLADTEAMASSKMIRTSAQKLNVVAGFIRGKSCERALGDLTFSKRRVAGEVKKVLEAAIANAENNHQLDVDRLYVAEATVGRAMVMKRWRARARGRTGRIMKPFSNLRVIVREREETV